MVARWPRRLHLGAALGALLRHHAGGSETEDGGAFSELPGVRCEERVDFYPLGHVGGAWTEFLHRRASELCAADEECIGFMRYVGRNAVHCHYWCGRPQFCRRSGKRLEANDLWVAYLKPEEVDDASLPEASEGAWREVVCEDVGRSSTERVVLLSEIPRRAPDPGACYVLQSRPDSPRWPRDAGQRPMEWTARLHGELVSVEHPEMPFFSADVPEVGAWRFFFDAHDYPARGLGAESPKRQLMSIFFLSPDATCPGPQGTVLTPDEAEVDLPGHVFVEDGTHETRRAAFAEYQIALLCGDWAAAEFPPTALVYSLAYAAHPLVPAELRANLSRAFFNLPDAAQAYKTVDVALFERLMGDLLGNPKKNDQVHYLQAFMFLGQQLFYYKYAEPASRRAEVAACAICEGRERARLRAAFEAAGPEAPEEGRAKFLFCSMSRRGAFELRRAVRETWAGLLHGKPAALRFFVGEVDPGSDDSEELEADVVELAVPESYRTINVKAFSMLEWAFEHFPHIQWLLRHDDDVYLRPSPVLAQLDARPPVRYLWGSFDHGSTPVREPGHPHYNSLAQCPEHKHPVWGDIFPPYARGHLWAMSADLLGEVVRQWKLEISGLHPGMTAAALSEQLPHPDDPALGIVIANIVAQGMSINIDDRDFNAFSLNPSCNSTFSNLHDRTWVVHHVTPDIMRCMWALDAAARGGKLADLCPCSTEVPEEEDLMYGGMPFSYPKNRFNTAPSLD